MIVDGVINRITVHYRPAMTSSSSETHVGSRLDAC